MTNASTPVETPAHANVVPAVARERGIEVSPTVSDTVRHTTCYMCACRCGINVHLKDGQVRYIEGNKNHPINKGVLCAKGSAGIMNHYSPARLQNPLRRVGPRGSGEFVEISWDEALGLATQWLSEIRYNDPRKLAFFTGRDQSQALTGWWASQFGTPNFASHGGFCSVNMAAAGLYSIGGSFWEFGEPDWHHTRYFMMFGIAEDHDSNPIKTGLSEIKGRGAKFVSVNPVKTGYSAIADEWIGITPGSDGLFILALVHELLRAGKVDLDYLIRYTNMPHLVIEAPGSDRHGLIARHDDGQPLLWDRHSGQAVAAGGTDAQPALTGRYQLADGTSVTPAFQLLAERYSDAQYAPANVSARTGIDAAVIERIAAELAHAAFDETVTLPIPWVDIYGREHKEMVGRPVSFHAMRGIAAHANGFHTCRALHILQMLLGSIDVPGGFRYKPPYPRPAPPGLKPAGKAAHISPGAALPGMPLGFPNGPEDLLVDDAGQPMRIDGGFSWEAPMSAHGMLHAVIGNAWAAEPYAIDTLFLYMANMAWNSSMNTAETIAMLTDKEAGSDEYRIPHIIYSDAFFSEMVPYADLVLPDTTYLERWDCISLLDRPICDADGVADSIRQPVVEPDRNVRPFQDVLLDLGARLGLPGMTTEAGEARYPGGYADYIVNHQRKPGVGPLAGWRGQDGDQSGRGDVNPTQLQRYIDNQCFWRQEIPEQARYFRFANRDYLNFALDLGLIDQLEPIVMQAYCEPLQRFRLAAQGHGEVQPPDQLRQRLIEHFDPLPIWYPSFEDRALAQEAETAEGAAGFPLYAVTQRPMAMYHSWGSQNAWLRQIHGYNRLYIPMPVAAEIGVSDDDWVWVVSRQGRVKGQVRVMHGVNEKTVWTWNAIGKRRGAWNLSGDAPESQQGFLLNHLIDDLLPMAVDGVRHANADPITGQAAWYDLRVRLEPVDAASSNEQTEPQWPALKLTGMKTPPAQLRFGAKSS